MKNFNDLMSEDKESTLNLVKSLYTSKQRIANIYFHSISIFIIASLVILTAFKELRTDVIFWPLFAIMTVVGLTMAIKAARTAKGYKLIIDTHS